MEMRGWFDGFVCVYRSEHPVVCFLPSGDGLSVKLRLFWPSAAVREFPVEFSSLNLPTTKLSAQWLSRSRRVAFYSRKRVEI